MLKLQHSGHLMRRADSLEQTLMPGKTKGKRTGRQRMRRLEGITDSTDVNLGELQETVEGRGACVLPPMGSRRAGHDLATKQQH